MVLTANQLNLYRKKLNNKELSAFYACGPVIWNSLPPDIRTICSCHSLRRLLKSHLFCETFNITSALKCRFVYHFILFLSYYKAL